MHIDQLETPVVAIDLDRLEANIDRLQQYLDKHNLANRPHIKTHKIPEIAHMQMRTGAVGITCQKVGEAEVMAQAGLDNIFLPYNILGASKLERLMHLARRITISVTADSETTVKGLADAAQSAAVELPVLIEFDSGAHRCGVQTPQEAADLARVIARAGGLHFGGLMTYPTSEESSPFVSETRRLLEKDGIPIETVSGGGSPRMWEAHTFPEITEHRSGTYVYGDRAMMAAGVLTQEQCAMHIIATVVSRPTDERVILDAGSKTLTSDLLGQDGHGLILEYPAARIYQLNEEHGYTDISACAQKPEVGERDTIIPNHCCVVSNMFNHVHGVRGAEVEVIWPVAARGALQ